MRVHSLRSVFLFVLVMSFFRHWSKGLSIASWNVNGLRSFVKHDRDGEVLGRFLKERDVDILCLQETKLQEMHVPELEEYMMNTYSARKILWNCSRARKGYSGTAMLILNRNMATIPHKVHEAKNFITSGIAAVRPHILNRHAQHAEIRPGVSDLECDEDNLTADMSTYGEENHDVVIGIGEHDGDLEGRAITFITNEFVLVNVYVPNSGITIAHCACNIVVPVLLLDYRKILESGCTVGMSQLHFMRLPAQEAVYTMHYDTYHAHSFYTYFPHSRQCCLCICTCISHGICICRWCACTLRL